MIALSDYIYMSHNVTNLVYHIVCPIKYRRAVISDTVDKTLKKICQEIEERYDIYFIEIGADKNHVHFLIQSVPKYSVSQLVKIIKSITARQIFVQCPEVKKDLWGGEFRTDGYYANTVSKNGSEKAIAEYVKNQGKESEYKQLYFQLR